MNVLPTPTPTKTWTSSPDGCHPLLKDVKPGSEEDYLQAFGADTATRSTPYDTAATNEARHVLILGAGLERDEQSRLNPRS
jgi:hypothetical protein